MVDQLNKNGFPASGSNARRRKTQEGGTEGRGGHGPRRSGRGGPGVAGHSLKISPTRDPARSSIHENAGPPTHPSPRLQPASARAGEPLSVDHGSVREGLKFLNLKVTIIRMVDPLPTHFAADHAVWQREVSRYEGKLGGQRRCIGVARYVEGSHGPRQPRMARVKTLNQPSVLRNIFEVATAVAARGDLCRERITVDRVRRIL